jgi:hypothetical protein
MDWPGTLPDLNPIKNTQAYMKAKLKKPGHKLPAKLVEAVKMMWAEDLLLEYFQCLSSSMVRCLKSMPLVPRSDDKVTM